MPSIVRPCLAFGLSLAIAVAPVRSFASMDAIMGKMFDGMVNTTPGAAYQTQSRGVIAGPSFYYRNAPIDKTLNLVSIKPPSVNVGCGAIDIHMGALSVMKGKDIEAALRAAAENATSYFFGLAIKTMSEAIWQEMSQAADLMRSLGQRTLDGCRLGKAAFDKSGFEGAVNDAKDWLSSGYRSITGTTDGRADDEISGASDGVPSSSVAESQAFDSGDTGAIKIKGNATWDVITKQPVPAWYLLSGSDQTLFKRQVMTMLGTVVTTIAQSDQGDSVTNTVAVAPVSGYLTAMVNGGDVTTYDCDDYTSCLQPKLDTKVSLQGLAPLIESYFLGDGTSSNPGIIAKVSMKSYQPGYMLTDTEKKVLASLPGHLRSALAQLSSSPESTKAFVGTASRYIAAEMVDALVLDISRSLQVAINNSPAEIKLSTQPLNQNLRDLRQESTDLLQATSGRVANALAMVTLPQRIKESFASAN